MQIKLKYHISSTTDLELDTISERILLNLNYKKYKLLSSDDQVVKFEIEPWQRRALLLNWRMYGGEFKIIKNTLNQTVVRLNYYVDILSPLVIIALLILVSILSGNYEGVLPLALFPLSIVLITNMGSNVAAAELLRDVLNKDKAQNQ